MTMHALLASGLAIVGLVRHRNRAWAAFAALSLGGALSGVTPAHATLLYATGSYAGGSGLYTVDPLTGASHLEWSLASPTGIYVQGGGLAYDPGTDTLYATGYDSSSADKLFTIDRFTGATATIGGTGNSHIDISSGGLAINPLTGVMYATGSDGLQSTGLFIIDKHTGAATLVGQARNGCCLNLYGLGFRGDGVLFANGFDFGSGEALDSHLYTVDLTTGAATDVGPSGVTLGRSLTYSGLAFTDDGTLLSLGSITGATSGLYSRSTANGAATLLGNTLVQFGVDGGLAIAGPASAPVSEPETWAMMLAGLALIGFAARRKTKRR